MNFFNPALLLLALPLGAGILLFWILRVKREPATVSSLYLWRSILQEKKANTPWRKLRRSLLLFLQLLAAFLLILALSRPFVYGREPAGRTIVIVIDTSASMNATDAAPSRLAVAKAAAEQFVQRDMDSSDSAAVLTVSDQPKAVIGLTGSKVDLSRAIERIAPTDTVADMPAALNLARALAGFHENAVIQVFTDGAFSSEDIKKIESIDFGATAVHQNIVGNEHPDNVAITALDARRNPSTGQCEVFVDVKNLGGYPHKGGILTLTKDGRLIAARALLSSGGDQTELFDSALLQKGGDVTARLEGVRDDLALDNTASCALPPAGPRRVLLVTSGNLFLERGLNLDPGVVLEEIKPGDYATAGHHGSGYALVVFDGWLPPADLPPGDYLTFGIVNGQTALTGRGKPLKAPAFIEQNRTHPLMRFVDLDGLLLRQSPQTSCADWASPLAEASSGPIIAAGEHKNRRIVSVAFDLSDSNWPLRVAFPIFLTNALDWLTTPEAQAGQQSGNPLNAAESNLSARIQPALEHPGRSISAAHSLPTRRRKIDLWPYAAAIALLFLTLEWFVFHRRV